MSEKWLQKYECIVKIWFASIAEILAYSLKSKSIVCISQLCLRFNVILILNRFFNFFSGKCVCYLNNLVASSRNSI